MAELSFEVGSDSVAIEHDGKVFDPEFQGYRQQYHYLIATDAWQYIGNDIQSGCGKDVDTADAARTLFSFLSTCAESLTYRDVLGYGGENADLFPSHVARWAQMNSDELLYLSESEM